MLTRRLERWFSPRVRDRGQRYFDAGRVRLVDTQHDSVRASVRGHDTYEVSLLREGRWLRARCDCDPPREEAARCKHVWAALLAADKESLLDWSGSDRVPLEMATPVESDSARGGSPRPMPWTSLFSAVGRPAPTGAWKEAAGAAEVGYFIDASATDEHHGVAVEIRQRRAEKEPWRALTWPLPGAREDDESILSLLAGVVEDRGMGPDPRNHRTGRYYLSHSALRSIVPKLIDTRRCWLRSRDGRERGPLRWEPEPWELWLEVTWIADGDALELRGALRRGDERLSLQEPELLVPGGLICIEDRVAPLDDFDAFAWVRALAAHRPFRVPHALREDFLRDLARMPSLPRLALPERLATREVRLPCQPVVRFSSGTTDAQEAPLRARVTLRYAELEVGPLEPGRYVLDPGRGRLIHRDRGAERRALSFLAEVGLKDDGGDENPDADLVLSLPAHRLATVLAHLLERGWRVEVDGSAVHPAGAQALRVHSGPDWFELHGDVEYPGGTARLPEILLAARRREATVLLSDGSRGLLPAEWLEKWGALANLGSPRADHLRYRRCQVSVLDALLLAGPDGAVDDRFDRLREEVGAFESLEPADAPEQFQGKLRPYQAEGLAWLLFLRRCRLGGVLADDMGLGKTVQVIAAMVASRAQTRAAPWLIVVPRSLMFNWELELGRFAPHLTVHAHIGSDRLPPGPHLQEYDVVLTTYGVLRRDILDLQGVHFDTVVLDEAQNIKNPAATAAKAARLLRADYRLALSGTPIENHLGELWSLFEFLNPGLLGASDAFGDLLRDAEGREEHLRRALRPFVLRRTKERAAPDLPPKTEVTLLCDLEPRQRKTYDELKAHYRNELLDMAGNRDAGVHLLEALLRLRQVSCHAGLVDTKYRDMPSGKLQVLEERLSEVIEENHKAVVFSQFTRLLSFVRDRLDRAGVDYAYLDGSTRDREAVVRRFQDNADCRVFLLSLRAGGVGLNLTAADYVFLLDPWWNPAVEAQAIDRAYRLGQVRPVVAYRLVARDTVEERVAELQRSKRALAESLLGPDSRREPLRREDLEALLGSISAA